MAAPRVFAFSRQPDRRFVPPERVAQRSGGGAPCRRRERSRRGRLETVQKVLTGPPGASGDLCGPCLSSVGRCATVVCQLICDTWSAECGIMWVIFDHLRPSGHIMPDPVGDRGAAHLDPGASRSPKYQAEECIDRPDETARLEPRLPEPTTPGVNASRLAGCQRPARSRGVRAAGA
jgi:hypothetical protein